MRTIFRYVGSAVVTALLAVAFFAAACTILNAFTDEKEMILEPLIIGLLAVVIFFIALIRTLHWSKQRE
jgi:hypothetical protein